MWKVSQRATERFFGVWKKESVWKEYCYFLTNQKEKLIFLLKKKEVAVSFILFLLLKCSCLILSNLSFLLMSWHSLAFLWNSSFQYLWPQSALICFWLDIWRVSYSQKSNAIDEGPSVPSWISCFTTRRIFFSLQVTLLFFTYQLWWYSSFQEKRTCHLASLKFIYINNYSLLYPNNSALHIFPSKFSLHEIRWTNTFITRWAIS